MEHTEFTTEESNGTEVKISSSSRLPSLWVGAVSNWAPLVVNIVINLLLWPYLIGHLGKVRFGMWALGSSFVGYFGLLRLGVGTGIMRYVPFYVGRKDHKAASEVISTGLVMFSVAGLVILAVSIFIAGPAARFYKAGAEFAALVRILGLAAAVECLLRVFDAGLRAREKWVAANMITVGTCVVRALGLAGCIYFGYALVEMSYVVLALTVISLVLIMIVFRELCPAIRLQPSLVRWSRVRELVFYGVLTVIITIAYSLGLQGHRLIVGKIVSLEAVSVYAVAVLFVEHTRHIVWAPLKVAWPRFALLDGENEHQAVASLFQRASRYSSILASGMVLLVLVAGPVFIRLWMSEKGIEEAVPIMIVLSLGCLVESSVFVGSSLLGGTGRQKANAIFAGIEGLLGFSLSILMGLKMGMIGVALGFTLVVVAVRGVACTWYVCRLLRISLLQFYIGFILRPWLIMVLITIVAYLYIIQEQIHGWVSLIVLGVSISVFYATCVYIFVIDRTERKRVLAVVQRISSFVIPETPK